MSADHAILTLPPRSPAVITTRRVPDTPCPTRHLTDVSDSHSVPSHPVAPCRLRPVYAASPMLLPCTVTDPDPVPARFSRLITLSPAMSKDIACVLLELRSPPVTTTLRVPRTPCPARHLTDVSDSHSVPSHTVRPCRDRAEYPTDPMLDPCTVTDADPVPPRFPRRVTLSPPKSTVHACVMLPIVSPAVITTRRVPLTPCPARHLTDVSDSHSVPSHPVRPCRPLAVYDTSPMPDPCTVTDPDPVPARFTRRVTLTAPRSAVHACVMVPTRSPDVITTRRVPPSPCPTRHLTDVSDSHAVPSHPVRPSRALPV